ncbi:hypothetical protein BDV97DRAFT_355136 [Delphinella strobiligena]|nr:hypothetical protein BDV97DRAFT_355136 [Delphinella strobiligena]
MVLQGSTSDDSFGPDQPASDIDPYASSSSFSSSSSMPGSGNTNSSNDKTLSYNIDTNKLPKPFFLLNLMTDNDKAMYHTIAENCVHAQQMLQRPLKQDEVDAIAFHFAKSLRIVSYGMPVGALVGGVYAYRGMSEMTFPFWKRGEGSRFNPNKFGMMSGTRARLMWHGLRFNLYAMIGAVTGVLFFSTYATTVNAVGTGSDPRLHDYIEAVKRRSEEARGQQQNVQRPVAQRNPVQSQEGMMDKQAMAAARRLGAETTYSRQDVQRRVQDYDDASPTGGAWSQDFHEEGGSPTDSGLLNDQQTDIRNKRQQVESETNHAMTRHNHSHSHSHSHSHNHNHSHSQSDSFDFDDASPTAGRAATSPFTDNSAKAGGSSWDRIRQNATSHAPNQSARASAWPSPPAQDQGMKREGATVGDSFAFSESDEERRLAKYEAQENFDANVEKERQGGDFTQPGSGASTNASEGSVWERLRRN